LSSGKLKNKKKAVVVEPEIDAEIEDEDFLEEKCRNLEGVNFINILGAAFLIRKSFVLLHSTDSLCLLDTSQL
jgi:hypothetical protein